MTVIDSHAHIGLSLNSGADVSETALLAAMDRYGIDLSMVMPQPRPDMEVAEIHDRIARLAEAVPIRIFGMANINPHVGEESYRRETLRCIRELGFRAIKLHPLGHSIAINSKRAEIAFALGRELSVPVLIHTGTGAPFALPALAIEPALAYPDVTISLAHAGFTVYTSEAIVAAKVCPNIILEPSWCTAGHIGAMITAVGAHRVMFGTDHLSNIPVELAKIEGIGMKAEDRENYLARTAARIFKLERALEAAELRSSGDG